jgi:hypothetical protein
VVARRVAVSGRVNRDARLRGKPFVALKEGVIRLDELDNNNNNNTSVSATNMAVRSASSVQFA